MEGIGFIRLKDHACKWERKRTYIHTTTRMRADKSPIRKCGKGSRKAEGRVQSSWCLRLSNNKRDPRKKRLCTVNKAASAIQLQLWGNRAFCAFFTQKQNYPRKLPGFFCQLLPRYKPATPQWRPLKWVREQQHPRWAPSNQLPGTLTSLQEGENSGGPENALPQS